MPRTEQSCWVESGSLPEIFRLWVASLPISHLPLHYVYNSNLTTYPSLFIRRSIKLSIVQICTRSRCAVMTTRYSCRLYSLSASQVHSNRRCNSKVKSFKIFHPHFASPHVVWINLSNQRHLPCLDYLVVHSSLLDVTVRWQKLFSCVKWDDNHANSLMTRHHQAEDT